MGSTWNFAFLAYEPRHPLLQYAAAGVVRKVLSQARAMRLGLPGRCYSPVSCVRQHGQSAPLGSAPARLLCLLRARLAALGSLALPGRGRPTGSGARLAAPKAAISPPLTMQVLKVTGPGSYDALVAEAAQRHNCTNKWLPQPHHCKASPSAMMRRIHVCRADGGDGAWLCNAFTHWTCKRRRSLRKCDKAHYTLQRRNATSFFHGTPRALPPPLLLRHSNATGDGGTPHGRGQGQGRGQGRGRGRGGGGATLD